MQFTFFRFSVFHVKKQADGMNCWHVCGDVYFHLPALKWMLHFPDSSKMLHAPTLQLPYTFFLVKFSFLRIYLCQFFLCLIAYAIKQCIHCDFDKWASWKLQVIFSKCSYLRWLIFSDCALLSKTFYGVFQTTVCCDREQAEQARSGKIRNGRTEIQKNGFIVDGPQLHSKIVSTTGLGKHTWKRT